MVQNSFQIISRNFTWRRWGFSRPSQPFHLVATQKWTQHDCRNNSGQEQSSTASPTEATGVCHGSIASNATAGAGEADTPSSQRENLVRLRIKNATESRHTPAMRLRPIVQFKHHNAGHYIKRKQSLEHARPGCAAMQQVTCKASGASKASCSRIAWVDWAQWKQSHKPLQR